MPSRFEIAKTGSDTHEVRLGTPGWEEGVPLLQFRLTIEAESVENINMETEEWENRKMKNGKVIITGVAVGFPWDSVRAFGLTSARCEVREKSEMPSFNATYIDETAREPKRVTLARKRVDYKLWRGPLKIEPRLRPAFIHNGLALVRQIFGGYPDGVV